MRASPECGRWLGCTWSPVMTAVLVKPRVLCPPPRLLPSLDPEGLGPLAPLLTEVCWGPGGCWPLFSGHRDPRFASHWPWAAQMLPRGYF